LERRPERLQSVLLRFVPKIVLKGGRRAFTKFNGAYREMSLNEMGLEMEFPRGEYIDPTGQAYRRVRWRTMKRRED
jgi:hypothetical protein